MTGQQLKNSILQEAIEGRLVPQDPNDEPASVLLDKIRKEKARLVKEGKLKKKDLEEIPVSEDEKPFKIPESWEWVRLEDITVYISRGKSPVYSDIMKYPIVAQKCNQWSGFSLDKAKFADPKTIEKYAEERLLRDGDLLWNSTGLGTLGRMAIYDSSINQYRWAVADSHVTVIRTLPLFCDYKYLFYYFASAQVQNVIEDKADGSTKQKELNQETVKKYEVPFPPLAEQKRIVAKIEELLPKVEEYGKAQDELNKLNEELPERLKKSILQEAIEGRLVPQGANDEPASVLLDKIRKEKARLVKEGKLKKKDLVETPISEDEKPFEIPESWEWCRVSDISESFIGLTYKPSDVSNSGWIVLRSSNIQNGNLDFSDIVKVNIDVPEKLQVRKNDIIICARNGSKKLVGKSALVNEISDQMTFGAFMAICRTPFYGYMSKYLLSPLFFGQLRKESDTTTINQLTQKNFNKYLVPLPPLAEQHRIVAKLEQLLHEIDKLKA